MGEVDIRRHSPAADLIFSGGPVYTADAARRSMAAAARDTPGDGPPADAVAVRGGRIVAVGGTREIQDLAGPEPRWWTYAAGRCCPGFRMRTCTRRSPE